MTFEGSPTFAKVIEEHFELKRRNARLESHMPIERYQNGNRMENHPLFKTEEQARIEDTANGTDPLLESELVLPGSVAAGQLVSEDSFWKRSREFNWGD